MSTESALLEPSLHDPRRSSRRRVENAITRIAAGFGALFYLQALHSLTGQADNLHPIWAVAVAVALGVGLVLAALCTLGGGGRLRMTGVFPLVYLVGLASWPLAVVDPAAAPTESFWLYYPLTLATVMAALAFPVPVAVGYLIGVPVVYGIIRVTPAGGSSSVDLAALDVVYAIILGGFVTIVANVLRASASAVDRARLTALERYRTAASSHAKASERMEVDSLVHDSVLTTLLAAARADSAEQQELVTGLATAAIDRLDEALEASPADPARVAVDGLIERIRLAAQALVPPVPVEVTGRTDGTLPESVAEALHGASVQAMHNSVQHAGIADRWVRIGAVDESGLEIEVGDDGLGFDVEGLPPERFGVRVSILERVAGVGGRVEIESAPGRGTRIRMSWAEAEGAAALAPVEDESSGTPAAEEAS